MHGLVLKLGSVLILVVGVLPLYAHWVFGIPYSDAVLLALMLVIAVSGGLSMGDDS